MATLVCRVQLLDDTDPFNSTNFPEPTRPPLYTFREDIPLATQLAGVHRLLRAPQKVLGGGYSLGKIERQRLPGGAAGGPRALRRWGWRGGCAAPGAAASAAPLPSHAGASPRRGGINVSLKPGERPGRTPEGLLLLLLFPSLQKQLLPLLGLQLLRVLLGRKEERL